MHVEKLFGFRLIWLSQCHSIYLKYAKLEILSLRISFRLLSQFLLCQIGVTFFGLWAFHFNRQQVRIVAWKYVKLDKMVWILKAFRNKLN